MSINMKYQLNQCPKKRESPCVFVFKTKQYEQQIRRNVCNKLTDSETEFSSEKLLLLNHVWSRFKFIIIKPNLYIFETPKIQE